MGVSVKPRLSRRRCNGNLCLMGHPDGPWGTPLMLIGLQMLIENTSLFTKNSLSVPWLYVATQRCRERRPSELFQWLFHAFIWSYNEVRNELVIATLPKDLWHLKGQKGIILKIPFNLTCVPDYGTFQLPPVLPSPGQRWHENPLIFPD